VIQGASLISTNSNSDLVIDFSEMLGYSSVLTIPEWKGENKCLITNDGETDGFEYNQQLYFSFSQLVAEQGVTEWVNKIPLKIRTLLLKHDELFENNWLALYLSMGNNYYISDLLESNPVLLAWLTQVASEECWSFERYVKIATSKQKVILQSVGLPANNSTVKTLSRISLSSLRHRNLQLLRQFFKSTENRQVNHIKELNVDLLKILSEYPELVTSALILHDASDINSTEFKTTFNDTFRLLNQLNFDDPIKRLGQCNSYNQLLALHDNLTVRLNAIKQNGELFVNFTEPPLEGNENIVPICNSEDLYSEGRLQEHCLGSYHNNIVIRNYYAYKVLQPERATLGIKRVGGTSWQLDQLKLAHNKEPSKETFEMVNQWMVSHQNS